VFSWHSIFSNEVDLSQATSVLISTISVHWKLHQNSLILPSCFQEFARMKNSVSKLEESQTINREEMMRVFSDVDGLKKQQQAMEIEQLKIQRNIQKIETQDLADISNKMKSIDRKFDEFDEFQESTKKALAEGNNDGDEKYSLIVAEMQKLKNQVN